VPCLGLNVAGSAVHTAAAGPGADLWLNPDHSHSPGLPDFLTGVRFCVISTSRTVRRLAVAATSLYKYCGAKSTGYQLLTDRWPCDMRIYRRIATRLSAVLVVIISANAILMGLAITRSGTDLLVNAGTQRLAQESRLVSVRLQDIFDAVKSDVKFIADSPAVADLVSSMDAGAGNADKVQRAFLAKNRLQEMFTALLNNHPWYTQIRVIGVADEGREVVRVDRTAEGITRVREPDLQQKGTRPYFLKTLDEVPGKVFWSAIELNQEQGKLVEPAQPVVRAAIPLAGKYGTPTAIVIINLDIRRVFDAAREVITPGTTLYIANEAGDYIYHPDPSLTFGFELGQRHLIQDDFTRSALDQVGTESLILEDVTPSGSNEPVIAHLSRLPLMATPGGSLIIALTEPRAHILAAVDEARRKGTGLIVPFLLVALAVVIWMVELFTGPLERVTRAMSRYAPGRKLHMSEVGRKDEVGQLAQACARMAARIDQQVKQLEEQNLRFKSLFEALPDAVIIIDQDGSVEYSNPATKKLFGYTDDEMQGQNIRMLMPEPYRSHHDEYMNRYLGGGEAHIIGIGRAVTGLHKNGTTLPLYLSIGEFTLQGRRKFTGILHDISLQPATRQSA
jgi:two-component system, sensor histidine kinase and response regulator